LKNILNWFGYPVTGVNEDGHISIDDVVPMRISPNPCVDRAFIHYQLGARSNVHLAIFNLLGQEIRVLLHESQDVGLHNAVWDGRDESGRAAPNGPYFLRLRAVVVSGGEVHTVTRKLSLMR
jgi:flagellar hook assembly protein FlgD